METASDLASATVSATTGNEASASIEGSCGIFGSAGSLALLSDGPCASIGCGTGSTEGLMMRAASPEGSESKNVHSTSIAANGSIAAPSAIRDERGIGFRHQTPGGREPNHPQKRSPGSQTGLLATQ